MNDKFITKEEFEKLKFIQYENIPVVKDFACPECGRSKEFPQHMNEKQAVPVGWCETENGFMLVAECPLCYTHFRYHISTTGRYDKDRFYEDFALHYFLYHEKNKGLYKI